MGAATTEAPSATSATGEAKVMSAPSGGAKVKRNALGTAKAGASNFVLGANVFEAARVASAPDSTEGVGRASCAAPSARGLAAPASRPVRLLLDTGAAAFLANG